ncbi:DegT/DnrJ/EryC1/StrS family aminotransferase [Aquimarina aquimarini]|uniref:DegT/DnrJ/EryC1/StrS family aminotransferase n=1 Tax=Aquimarina aquimarini TaxID=1191734 RepID=UPI000D552E19|nr:aminotransferase class V-fold PLP-dependent enzyme [Aquimarina aquimarini]
MLLKTTDQKSDKVYDNCFINIDDSDFDHIKKALQKDRISGKSEVVKQYEASLANFFDSPFALACSNGTLGIQMVLMANNVASGDEVILPSTAPVMCVFPIMSLGAIPIFVDTHTTNFNLDIEDLKKKISSKTKIVMNVPMWGYANNIEEIVACCHSKNIKVVEDNSHCHATQLNKKYLGVFGDYAVFSTHERKMITTAEGGFLLVKNSNDYQKLHELRSFGESAIPNDNTPYGNSFGLNFRISGINAALGISQLAKIENKIQQRHTIAQTIVQELSLITPELKELVKAKSSRSNYYAMVLLADSKLKDNLEQFLFKKNIISDPFRYGYAPLYDMNIFKKYKKGNCHNSEFLIKSVLTLPTHEGLSDYDIEYIIKTIRTYFDG